MSTEPNPWLAVPLEDYEGHMQDVLQLEALAELFGEALGLSRPRSVAVLGVAGGNGLERIDPAVTTRVVGVDINRAYLAKVAQRFRNLPGLELHRVDLSSETIAPPRVALVHAALIFEHAGTGRCLENALALVEPGGHLSVVLQEPGEWEQRPGGDRYTSIRSLRGGFSPIEPEWFCGLLGLEPVHRRRCPVPGGWFWLGVFRV